MKLRIYMMCLLMLAQPLFADDNLLTDEESAPQRRTPSIFHRPEGKTPEEQFVLAEKLRESGKIRASMKEYRALVHEWHNSPEAAKAQEAYAKLFLQKGKYRRAFNEFQYLIDHFAGQFDYREAIKEQFRIARHEMTRRKHFLFMIGYTSPEAALPLFEQIVVNAPGGEHAAEAQFYIGVIHENENEFNEAASAYRAVRDCFAGSRFARDASFRYAYCLYRTAKKNPRDEFLCRNAFSELAAFKKLHSGGSREETVDTCMNELKTILSGMYYDIALFYDRPMYRPRSALIAYTDFIRKFPSSDRAPAANNRIAALEKLLNRRGAE